MKTYTFIEKNGFGVLYLSAENDLDVDELLEETVKYPDNWECDGSEDID